MLKRKLSEPSEPSELAAIQRRSNKSEAVLRALFSCPNKCCSRASNASTCLLQGFWDKDEDDVSIDRVLQFMRHIRGQVHALDEEDFQRFMSDRYRDCLISSSADKEHELRYVLICEQMGIQLEVCRKSFMLAYGATDSESTSDSIEKQTPLVAPPQLHINSHPVSLFESMKKVIKDNVVTYNERGEATLGLADLDPWQISLAYLPDTDEHIDWFLWMRNYFNDFGDHKPNRDGEVTLSMVTKHEIYCKYVDTAKSMWHQNQVMAYSEFVELWNDHFPFVTIREKL